MRRLATILPLILLFGCASLSSYQQARTTPKGTGQTRLGATRAPIESPWSGDPGKTTAWMYQIGQRYGFTERFDVGMDFVPATIYSIDAKYLILGLDSNSLVQVSSGLKATYSGIVFRNSEAPVVSTTLIDLIVPVYATFTPAPWVGLTIQPQLCVRTSLNELALPSENIVGANLSLQLGRRLGVVGEIGFHHPLTTGNDMVNYGAMLLFPLDVFGDLAL